MMRKTTLASVLLYVAVMAGCGESVAHRMQRAQIALSNGKPDLALKLVNGVLARDGGNIEARLLKGEAEVRLLRLGEAQNTLAWILKDQPDNAKAHRQLAGWATARLANLLRQSDFGTNSDLQAQFASALATGQAQAQWLRVQAKAGVEADYLVARLTLLDVNRLQALLKVQENTLPPVDANGAPQPQVSTQAIDDLRKRVTDRTHDAEKSLQAAIEADPRDFDAVSLYLSLLKPDKEGDRVEALCRRMTPVKDLPADLVGKMVLNLLLIPPDAVATAQVLDVGRQLQANVDPKQQASADWHNAQARLLLKGGDAATALLQLDATLKKDPRNVPARYLKAQCLLEQQNLGQAQSVLERLIPQVQGTDAEGFVQMLYGTVMLERHDLLPARAALRRSLDLDPGNAMTYQLYLRAQSESGLLDQSGPDVDAFYARNPANPQAVRFKMQYEEVRGRRDALLALLHTVEHLWPLQDEHLNVLVDGYMYLQKYDQAAGWAQELVQRHPNDLGARLRLAQALLMQGQDAKVRIMLIKLAKEFPKAGDPDSLLAQLYLNRESYDHVVDLMRPIVAREPDNMQARFTLARGFAGLALFDDALAQLRVMLEKNPRDARAHSLAARIYQCQGQAEKAAEQLAQIDADAISESTNPALLAELKYRQKQYDKAADICNRALAGGVADPALYQVLAGVYIHKGDYARAEANMLGLVRLQPHNGQAYVSLARFYIAAHLIDKGLVATGGLQKLDEPLARMAQALLLTAANRLSDAVQVLIPAYERLLEARDRRAMLIAGNLAQLHLALKNLPAALADYAPLIKAGFMASEARFRQIMIDAQAGAPPATTVAALDELVPKLNPDDQPLRLSLIRAFAGLGKVDRALRLVDAWIAQQPDRPDIVGLKAELLVGAGRPADAATLLRQSLEHWPKDEATWHQLAGIYAGDFNFPAAEAAYENMARLSPGARLSALAAMGQMFVALGLNQQAAATFNRLEKTAQINDPHILLAMGQALHLMGQDDLAAKRLAQVPAYSPRFAAAQVLLAQIEEATGHPEDARKRIGHLMSDPAASIRTCAELLRLNIHSEHAEDLIRRSDQGINLNALPPGLRRQWLDFRIIRADRHGDVGALKDSLDRMLQTFPDRVPLQAAKVLALIRGQQPEAAREAFKGWASLRASPYGPLLSAALGQPVTIPAGYGGWPSYLVAMAQGDTAGARAALDRLQASPTVYASDLREVLNRRDATSDRMKRAFRQLATAQAAEQAQLLQMSADYAQDALKGVPDLAPAYAVLAQALLDNQQGTASAFTQIKQVLPEGSITSYLAMLDHVDAGEYGAAVQTAQDLVQRNPGNPYIRYMLTQLYDRDGQYDAAIAGLERIVADTQNPFYSSALNDLAYLLAEHQPKRMEEADQMAHKAYDLSGQAPMLLDTLGWIDHLRGDNQGALKYLTRAVGPLSTVPEVHYHLGMVYRDLGHKNWARYNLAVAARSTSRLAPQARKALDAIAP